MNELTHKRGWDSKVFDTGRKEGKKTIYGAKLQNGIHDIDPDGSYVDCNPSMRDYVGNVSTLEAIRGRYGSLRAGDTGNESKDRVKILTKRNCGVSLKLCGHKTYGPWEDTTRKIRFDTNDGITLNYYPSYKGVNIVITIDNPQTASNIIKFSLKKYGCDYIYEEKDRNIIARSSTGKDDIYINALYAVDANGDSGEVYLRLGDIVDGYQIIEKVIAPVWLGNAVGPVNIDPDITIEDGVDGGIINDSFLNSSAPTANYGSNISIGLHELTPGSPQPGIIYVSLTDYGDVVWLNGKFTLSPRESGGSLPYNVKVWRLLKAWTENTVTYNSADVAWQTPGAKGALDRASVEEATVSVDNAATDFPILAATLNDYWGGDVDNNGVLLEASQTGGYVHMHSSDSAGIKPVFYGEYIEDDAVGFSGIFGVGRIGIR